MSEEQTKEMTAVDAALEYADMKTCSCEADTIIEKCAKSECESMWDICLRIFAAEVRRLRDENMRLDGLFERQAEMSRRFERARDALLDEMAILTRSRDGWKNDALKYKNDADFWKGKMQWRPIESAPEGLPGYECGSRDASEWFLALKSEKYGGPTDSKVYVVRRIYGQSYPFECSGESNYVADYFTHWMSLPDAPSMERAGLDKTHETKGEI